MHQVASTRHKPPLPLRPPASQQENEACFRQAMEALSDGLWDWDIQSGTVYYSDQYWLMLGYTPDPAKNSPKDWLDLIHPDDRDRALATNLDCVENRCERFEVEFRARAADGTWRWILGRGRAISHDPAGKSLRLVGTHIDITARKLADEKLQESEARLRFALEGANDGLWDVDLPSGRAYLSPRSCEILGYEHEELRDCSAPWSDLVHPDDLALTNERLQSHIDGQEPIFQVEQRLRTKSGDWRWVLARGKVVSRDESGNPLRITGTHTDITDQKHLEQQYLQAQKMEAVGLLAGGVAHDYNNMLTVILGYSEILLKQVDEDHPFYKRLSEIHGAAEKSSHLTRQLLAFARKQLVDPKVLDLNEAVSGTLKMLRRLIGENISLTWSPSPDLWALKIDPSQVDQILANLCVNARDAIAGVGRINIETGNVTLDERYCRQHVGFLPGEYLVLTVSDTGSGMDKATLEKIFEPYFTTKKLGQGTGLGLSTVYGIVKQNNGFINVYSEPDQGTTFRIYLPRWRGAGDQAAAGEQAEPVHGNETILLVEDEPAILAMAKEMLEDLGYQVLAAAGPMEATTLAKSADKIDLVVTDVIMPEMGGQDMVRWVRMIHPGVKCLFMSGYTANAIAHHGVLDEGIYFLQKPFSQQDLAAKVRAALESNHNHNSG